jgi:hypothetical protein
VKSILFRRLNYKNINQYFGGVDMSVILKEIRLIIATDVGSNDGTDDPVYLDFNIKEHPDSSYQSTGWQRVNLDNPGNDREPGNTDLYEIKFFPEDSSGIIEGVGVGTSTTVNIPPGIAFNRFENLREMPFFLLLHGNDMWKIKLYILMGHVMETWWPPNAIDSNLTYDHGWILLASNATSFKLSKETNEAPRSFHCIDINAVFPSKREPNYYILSKYGYDMERDPRYPKDRYMRPEEE